MTDPKIVLFGATGYTGHLVAEALVRRGLRPLLCGRNKDRLDALSDRLGGLGIVLADVNDEAAMTALLSRGDILISTVGPFVQYGHTAISAAVKKGAFYIDSTGEPAFIRTVFETFGPKALATGATLITACGYDYIPGNCAAGLAINATDNKAVRVDIGYYTKKNGHVGAMELSQGTRASLRLAMVAPVKVWRAGALVEETGGIRVRRFSIGGHAHPALSISCTEHFSLPRVYPFLKEINTYLGWFGKGTYLMQRAARMQRWLLKIPGYRYLATQFLSMGSGSTGKGPDAGQRQENVSHIVAEVFDDIDDMLARVEMEGVDGYTFTANIMAWAAHMALERPNMKAGAVGPIEAFGLDTLRKGCQQSGLKISVFRKSDDGFVVG